MFYRLMILVLCCTAAIADENYIDSHDLQRHVHDNMLSEEMLAPLQDMVGDIKVGKGFNVEELRDKALANEYNNNDSGSGTLSTMQGVDINEMFSRYGHKSPTKRDLTQSLPQLMIFISFSQDKQALSDLIEQGKKLGAYFVIRGLVGDSYKKTAFLVKDLSEEGAQVQIDPKLYKMFDINHVPSFVLLKDSKYTCNTPLCDQTPLHDKISGEITLDYALSTIESMGDHSSEAAKYLLSIYRGEDK